MLTDKHIAHIKANRSLITQNRKEDVVLFRKVEGAEDPFTGEPTLTQESTPSAGTWTSLTSESGGEGEIEYVNGVRTETDDVVLELDIDEPFEGTTEVERVSTGERYVVKAQDRLGLGENNRYFVLLAAVT